MPTFAYNHAYEPQNCIYMATSISDTPITGATDFETKPYVDGLVNFIKDSETPLTIALQGEWGSGKTSLMNTLYKELCPKDDKDKEFTGEFIGITINTWEYSMLASPEVTVINILGRLVKDISSNNKDVVKKVKGFVSSCFSIGYKAVRDLSKSYSPKLVSTTIESLTPSDVSLSLEDEVSLSELRKELEKAIEELIGKEKEIKKKGIIIFVDDLDRLNPPVAVEILELLKNVFTLEHCIFVLAIDYDVVVKGLEPKFGKLTAKNEREFRSFFDKIIQVPFSIPVSSYKPKQFITDSLKSIGYLNDNEDVKPYEAIIKKTVGNNPRSLKRLINTLSLLRCIKKSDDNKLLNFIIVAIQICYPRIYSLLVDKPDFEKWDYKFAVREGISIKEDDISDWEDVLKAACSADVYLTRRYDDIQDLFSAIKEDVVTGKSIGDTLQNIMESTSVTGVKADMGKEAFDKKMFIRKLHERVGQRISQKRPETEITPKNNTGSGGFNLFTDEDGHRFGVKFVPSYNQEKDEVTMSVEMSTKVARSLPEMEGLKLEDMLMQTRMKEVLSVFNSVVMPLLKNGDITSKNGNYSSYEQELKDMHVKGYMSDDITHDAVYRISRKPKDFESDKVIDALADLIIANYDFRKAVSSRKNPRE